MIASVLWRLVAVLHIALLPSAAASVLPDSQPHVALSARQADPDGFPSALCQPPCELGSCGTGGSCPVAGGLLRRGLAGSERPFDPSLNRRLFTWVANSQDSAASSGPRAPKTNRLLKNYHVDVARGLADSYYKSPLICADRTSERPISQQIVFGASAFQILVAGHIGCTTVIVASTKAVWMTHFWESYSNGKDAEGDNLVNGGDPAFNQRVLMFLRGQAVTNPLPNGYPRPYRPPQGPGIDKTLFNDKSTFETNIYVFTPTTIKEDIQKPENLKYPARYGTNGEVHTTICDILGPDIFPRFTVVPYLPLNMSDPVEEAQLGTDERGSVLFQYDPDSDGKGQRRWRVLLENTFKVKNVPAPAA
ncbi:hypothetical protein C8A05DRAFT_20589 [Staphylotrichum tortipilum]|uniref:Uncharacterized protein n=1 Tax=Staphylotrichum tortipilum TaxID=2831512 RepID=A0AAN6RMI2_9PEZI|nr:hypothetical protein C8A05DRAFT_20589 [Staphylotrichum longicolle]